MPLIGGASLVHKQREFSCG